MRRREFLGVLGGAVATWPLTARAQQPAMPMIGFLSARSPNGATHLVAAYRQGLGEAGYVEGQNVTIEYRWADGSYDRLPALAVDLVRRQAAVIAATGGNVVVVAAKAATATTPIVVTTGSDPVASGLVASLSRPGGNVTGIHMFLGGLESKRLGLLRELVPGASIIAVIWNPAGSTVELQLADLKAAARDVGQQIQIFNASTGQDLDAAFAAIAQVRAGGLIVAADPFLNSQRDKIIALATRYAIPAVYDLREFAEAGGLMSYGTNLRDAYRQLGVYTGRLLKGAKPADLPVLQSTTFELVINLKTARTLGIEVPSGLSSHADEIIE